MMHMRLLDIETLSRGSERQRAVYAALKEIDLFGKLNDFGPVLAGSIPLDVDTPESDVDVICGAQNLEEFADRVRQNFANLDAFCLTHRIVGQSPTVIGKFRCKDVAIEVFAQSTSPFTQPAVVHLLVEARMLSFAPKQAKDEIRSLKSDGLSTEEAFAKVFELAGDPYAELLRVARLPDHEILHIVNRFRFRF